MTIFNTNNQLDCKRVFNAIKNWKSSWQLPNDQPDKGLFIASTSGGDEKNPTNVSVANENRNLR